MRVILLALTIGAAAVAGAAPAQPGSTSRGPRADAQAPRVAGSSLRSPPRPVRDVARSHGSRRGHRGAGLFPFAYFGFGDHGPPPDAYGDGFFAQGGGEVRMRGRRPVYDYDRDYPYEWSGSDRAAHWTVLAPGAGEALRCRVERGVRVCRGPR